MVNKTQQQQNPRIGESFLLICYLKTFLVEETLTSPNFKELFVTELVVMVLSICKHGGLSLEM